MGKMLRGVVVTNAGTDSEAVVMAIEAHPWHTSPNAMRRCKDAHCLPCHRIFQMEELEFNFELRRVYPVGNPHYPKRKMRGIGQIPKKDLPKFNADFGLYYSS